MLFAYETERLLLKIIKPDQADAVLFKDMSVEEKLLLRRLMLQMRENLFSVKEINLKELMETCPHMDQTEKEYVKTRRKDRC